MRLFKLSRTVTLSAIVAISTPAFAAGIPVFDAANFANMLTTIQSWGQQYNQMVQQITEMQNNVARVTTLTTKFDGGRGLGTILDDSFVKSAMPAGVQNVNLILTNALSGAQTAAIQSVMTAYGMPASPGIGTSEASQISTMQAVLDAAKKRELNISSLGSQVDTSPDAKASLDLLNRNVLELASINNQLMQTMAISEASRNAGNLRAQSDSIAALQAMAAAQKASR